MNIETIEMDQDEANERAQEYAQALRRRYDEEYEAVQAGLEELAAGKKLFSLQDAIRAGGFDDEMRPLIAIARADREFVKFEWGGSEVGLFDARHPRSPVHSDTLEIRVDLGQRHGRREDYADGSGRTWRLTVRGWTLIPMVPPHAVSAGGGVSRLREYHVLWEVEEWSDRPIGPEPPRDPYLVRRLGGDLWAVIAEWDLTELERLVMAGRSIDG